MKLKTITITHLQVGDDSLFLVEIKSKQETNNIILSEDVIKAISSLYEKTKEALITASIDATNEEKGISIGQICTARKLPEKKAFVYQSYNGDKISFRTIHDGSKVIFSDLQNRGYFYNTLIYFH